MNIIHKFNTYKKEYYIKKRINRLKINIDEADNKTKIREIENFLYYLDDLSVDVKKKYHNLIFPILLNIQTSNYVFSKFESDSSYFVKDDFLDSNSEKNLRNHIEKNLLVFFKINPELLRTHIHHIKDNITDYDLFINFANENLTFNNVIHIIFEKLKQNTLKHNRKYSDVLNKINYSFFNKQENIDYFIEQIKLEKEHSYFFDFSNYLTPEHCTHYNFVKHIIFEIRKNEINIKRKENSDEVRDENNDVLNFFYSYLIKIMESDEHLSFLKSFVLFEEYISSKNLKNFKNNEYYHKDRSDIEINKLFYFLKSINKDKSAIICRAILEDRFLSTFGNPIKNNLKKESLETLLEGVSKHKKYSMETLFFMEALYLTYTDEDLKEPTIFTNHYTLKSMLGNDYYPASKYYTKKGNEYGKFINILSAYKKNSEEYKDVLESYFKYFILHNKKEENISLINLYKQSYSLNNLCYVTQSFPYSYNIPDDIVIHIWKLFKEDDFEKFSEQLFSSNLSDKKNIYFSIKEKYMINNRVFDNIVNPEDLKIKPKRL